MCDLPMHAQQIALLRNLHDRHFPYAELFHIHWFTPYLFGYLLVYALASFTTILTACKILISLVVAGIVLSTSMLLKQARIDQFWAILTIPGIYGLPFQWGFLNYLVAVPIGLLFLWFVLVQLERTGTGSKAAIALFSIVLFFCHALVCGFFIFIAGLYVMVKVRPMRRMIAYLLTLCPVALVALIWLWVMKGNKGVHRPINWDLNWFVTGDPYYRSFVTQSNFLLQGWGRINGFFPRLIGCHSALICTAIGCAIFLLLTLGVGLEKCKAGWIPFLTCLGVLFVVPDRIFGTDLVYQRFSIFALPLFLLTIKKENLSKVERLFIRSAAILLVIFSVILAGQRALGFSRETKGFQQMLTEMQPQKRVLSMMFDHEDGISIAPTFLHFGGWYAAEKSGIADPSAAMMFPELVVFKKGHTPKAVLWGFEWDPGDFEWNKYNGEIYNYFIVRSGRPVDQYFASARCEVVLRYHYEDWELYQAESNCNASNPSRPIKPAQ